MELSSINVRYAKAFFSLAREKNKVELAKKDLEWIREEGKSAVEFELVISNPVIKPSQKIEIFRKAFGPKIQPMTMTFLELLIRNKRENQLFGIIRWFLHEYRLAMGIETASLITAITLDDPLRQKIKQMIKEHFNKEIELAEQINPDIIGGYILKIDDLQYDGSIISGLKKIRRELLNRK